MTEKLRVCVVGAGYFSQFHYDAWGRMAAAEEVEVVGVCDRDRAKAEAVAAQLDGPPVFTDFTAMLKSAEADVVDIVTPPPTHVDFVTAAVDHGLAVICQKPFTPDLATAEALVADVSARGGRVFIHENFRFQPWHRKLKALLDDGVVGDPYEVLFLLRPGDGQGPDAYLSRQPYFQQMPRFLVHETAIHLIDVFRFLFGEVTAVYAQLDRLNPAIAGEDAGIILFDFANGRRGVFDGNRLSDHDADNTRLTMGEMRIDGSGGTLSLDGYADIRLRKFGTSDDKPVAYDWPDRGFAGDSVFETNRHIVHHLTGGAPAMNVATDYLSNLRIVDAVYRSSATGTKIQLPDGG